MHPSNSELVHAFPAGLRNDALLALSALPENPRLWNSFSVRVAGEVVALPYRIYHDPTLIDTASLTSLHGEMIDCLLTRHNDGFVRQDRLTRIISSGHSWTPPFVLQLVGEYVIEILRVIHQNLGKLNTSTYEQFLRMNPEFLARTEQRVISYWDCYYRNYRADEYVGFQVLQFFKDLVADPRST
jgi:hypothetical protein